MEITPVQEVGGGGRIQREDMVVRKVNCGWHKEVNKERWEVRIVRLTTLVETSWVDKMKDDRPDGRERVPYRLFLIKTSSNFSLTVSYTYIRLYFNINENLDSDWDSTNTLFFSTHIHFRKRDVGWLSVLLSYLRRF